MSIIRLLEELFPVHDTQSEKPRGKPLKNSDQQCAVVIFHTPDAARHGQMASYRKSEHLIHCPGNKPQQSGVERQTCICVSPLA